MLQKIECFGKKIEIPFVLDTSMKESRLDSIKAKELILCKTVSSNATNELHFYQSH